MSILDEFFATDSIQLDPVGLDVVEPPQVAGIDVIPRGPRSERVPCVLKRFGSLDATLTVLGLSIPFRGTFLGVDSIGRWLIRWSVDDRTPRPFSSTTIRRIRGQITAAILPLEPFRADLATCTGAAGEYFVTLSMIPPDDLDERFGRLPNEVRIEADIVTATRALVTAVRGDAGVAAPPATPWPQPTVVTFSRSCVPSARSTRSVFGQVHLDTPVRRSHAGFRCSITAVGDSAEPGSAPGTRVLDVRSHPPVGRSVIFEVMLPPDLTGAVRVTAITNNPSRRASAEFHVGGGRGFGCGDLIMVRYYEPIRVGCEAWDCGWTGLNDLSELIGRSGGMPVRYLTSRRVIDSVGRVVGDQALIRAINNHGRIVGAAVRGKGKTQGFVYGEPLADGISAPEVSWVPGVTFTAINDEGVAVGGRVRRGRMVPVRWVKGELERVKVPSKDALALAVDGAGNLAGLHVPDGNGMVRVFIVDETGFHDLGDPGGSVVALTMNGAGAVAGTYAASGQNRGFLYSSQTGWLDLEMPESTQSTLCGLNDEGTAVGTLWDEKTGVRRAFRFTLEYGVEDLSALVSPERAFVADVAIGINNLGQILVQGSENGQPGYFLLNPDSVPAPELPIS